MDWIELIQLRSFTPIDRDEAAEAFHQLVSPVREIGLMDITMFKDISLRNDICIFLSWSGDVLEKGKSSLGTQLAETFSSFGQIYHSVWVKDTQLNVQ